MKGEKNTKKADKNTKISKLYNLTKDKHKFCLRILSFLLSPFIHELLTLIDTMSLAVLSHFFTLDAEKRAFP